MQELAAAFAAAPGLRVTLEERPQCDGRPGGQRSKVGRARPCHGAACRSGGGTAYLDRAIRPRPDAMYSRPRKKSRSSSWLRCAESWR